MPGPTIAELQTAQTRDVIQARILAALVTKGYPTSQWKAAAAGGVEMATVEMVAGGLASIVAPKIADIALQRFLDTGDGDGLQLYALKRYKLLKRQATATIQNIKLTTVASAPPYSFGPGELGVRSKSGHFYRSIEAVSIPPGSGIGPILPVDVLVQAITPGSAYADPAGTILDMETAPAGLTCINQRRDDFAPTHTTGGSSGTVTGAFLLPGVPPTFDSIRVRIDAFGEIGTARYSVSTDGGASWTPMGTVPSLVTIEGQAKLTFTNGTAPSFIQGTIFTLLVGDAIVQRGTDIESDTSLANRCRWRWASLSDIPTPPLVKLWAMQASPEVVRIRVDADPNTAGGFLVTIASATGPASPAAALAVQDYITPLLLGYRGLGATAVAGSPVERALCSSAKPVSIVAGGLVEVPSANVAAVQRAADLAWGEYVENVPIGGTVRLAELIQAVRDAGAIDFSSYVLNGIAANVELTSGQVAIVGGSLTTSLNWRPV